MLPAQLPTLPPSVIDCVMTGVELHPCTMATLAGDVPGYQWRLTTLVLESDDGQPRPHATTWMFASLDAVAGLLRTWQEQLQLHGHLPDLTTQGLPRH